MSAKRALAKSSRKLLKARRLTFQGHPHLPADGGAHSFHGGKICPMSAN
jgi:hypothetical protein